MACSRTQRSGGGQLHLKVIISFETAHNHRFSKAIRPLHLYQVWAFKRASQPVRHDKAIFPEDVFEEVELGYLPREWEVGDAPSTIDPQLGL